MQLYKKNYIFATAKKTAQVESFFRTHKYLVDHLGEPIPRLLMDQIDWSHPLIGIKGTRGVGKTTFLLQYAKKYFNVDKRDCLYVNLNHFYFAVTSITDFARKFVELGGKTLLLDQVYKFPGWTRELRICRELFPELKIVFAGSTVMSLEEDTDITPIVNVYNLRGFSFREFLNILTDHNFEAYNIEDIINNHHDIARQICSKIDPFLYFKDYIHHGYYPFFLEKKNFSENLLKTINMMLEVDVLSIRQIELSYLPKLRRLLYILSQISPGKPNISQLSVDCEISRATVTNYLEYLKGARLINMLYHEGDEYPKKPDMLYMHNTNLVYLFKLSEANEQELRETFFYNQVHHSDSKLNKGTKKNTFVVEKNGSKYSFKIESKKIKGKKTDDIYHIVDKLEIGENNIIPLWLFGFLY